LSITIHQTAFFGSDAGRGWSESHECLATDPIGDMLPYLQTFKTLLDTYRVPLLGEDRRLERLRLSYKLPNGSIASSSYEYTPYTYPGNKRTGSAPSVAAECRMGEISNTGFSNIYLRGFWDDVEIDEQLNYTTAAGKQWKSLLDQYVAALVRAAYGWETISDDDTPRGNVTGYTIDLTGFVTFTFTITNGVDPFPVGSIVEMKVSRLNNSSSPLNTTHKVQIVSPTTAVTLRQTAAGPFKSSGTFSQPVRSFAFYTGMQYSKLAKRSEGRPTGRSPARRKARARY
jgi:hypothetical protein